MLAASLGEFEQQFMQCASQNPYWYCVLSRFSAPNQVNFPAFAALLMDIKSLRKICNNATRERKKPARGGLDW